MEDTIEVCAGCGKMPRAIDLGAGSFVCSRCGNRTTIQVSADNYEKVVSELDARFHAMMLQKKAAAVPHEPIGAVKSRKPAAKAAKKAGKAPAKKSAPKKAARKRK